MNQSKIGNPAVYCTPDNVVKTGRLASVAVRRSRLRWQLKNALSNGLLDVYYQPQVDLRDGSCCDLEALVRWNDDKIGSVSPSVFIPVAEELGLIDEITHFVIARVQSDLRAWRQAQLPVKSVAINVSARHFSEQRSVERLLNWLTQESLPAGTITLELTETAMLQNTELARRYMQELQNKGFCIALDDFGTGYSSVAYLLDFPITQIKIDRSFVTSMLHSSKCQAIVQALILLARQLSIEIVAEGVEQLEEAQLLKGFGCLFAQGYFFSRALPEREIAEYLRSRKTQGSSPRISRRSQWQAANF